MSSFGRYTPRRRRGDEEQREGGGLPVIPLMIIVVFAGLLLGGLLAHFFGNRGSLTQTAMNPPPVTPIASATPMPAITPRPRPSRTPKPRISAKLRPTPKRVTKVSPSPTASALPSISPQPAPSAVALKLRTPQPAFTARPVVVPTATIRATVQPLAAPVSRTLPPVVTEPPRTEPPRTPKPARQRQVAHIVALHVPRTPDGVVRAYLSALAAGRRAAATTYLASGSPTEESFMRGARIADIRATDNGDGTYNVTADVIARRGARYRVVATVAALPYGMLITDHFAIRPP